MGICDNDRLPFIRDENKSKITIAREFYQKNPNNHIELYFGHATNRYATFTGNALNDKELTDGTKACFTTLDKDMRRKPKTNYSESRDGNREDFDIICSLRKQKIGEKFSKLYDHGDWQGCGQKGLKARISELKCEIATDKENSLNVNHFLDFVKRYTEVPELTAEIIREFIEKVYVYHPEKINGQKTQRVRIVWNCIGEIPTQNKTA